uniref:(northern house mosquito) hypothetical protein n=1 Tax=Culex pipiens TaxID=7175 RepID=A0A8D8H3N4_CULPI
MIQGTKNVSFAQKCMIGPTMIPEVNRKSLQSLHYFSSDGILNILLHGYESIKLLFLSDLIYQVQNLIFQFHCLSLSRKILSKKNYRSLSRVHILPCDILFVSLILAFTIILP